jgi:hypothetical protein
MTRTLVADPATFMWGHASSGRPGHAARAATHGRAASRDRPAPRALPAGLLSAQADSVLLVRRCQSSGPGCRGRHVRVSLCQYMRFTCTFSSGMPQHTIDGHLIPEGTLYVDAVRSTQRDQLVSCPGRSVQLPDRPASAKTPSRG